MVEFDNDGKVLQTLNQKIEHNDLDDAPTKKSRYIPRRDDFIEFVWSYLNTHKYSSKKFLAGKCVDEFHPLLPRSQKNIQQNYKRKISIFFGVLKELGLVSHFSTTTVTVNFEKIKEYSLDDIYEIYK